ncbi:MAG: CaiB/BaiF CoA-transferase family protein [Myxococcota bacterium]
MKPSGPLTGVRVVEFSGIGPTPFAGMLLADLGADVLRIDRPTGSNHPHGDIVGRGRASLPLDLKSTTGHRAARAVIEKAELLLEGFRPGVMERLGLGPIECHALNPGLVYGRMTGWGQSGPLAASAGHDLNYIALSGALWSFGEAGRVPSPPLNLLGDFGAGSTFVVIGLLAGLLNARKTGVGDVVDAAIYDGANTMMGFIRTLAAKGRWSFQRGRNYLDGSAPNYGVYECADGRWITIAALEPAFFRELLDRLNLDPEDFQDMESVEGRQDARAKLEEVFRGKTRDAWRALLEGTDACFAPVLDPEEALHHPHAIARGQFDHGAGTPQPVPAPRFARAALSVPRPAPARGDGAKASLINWGVSPEVVAIACDQEDVNA